MLNKKQTLDMLKEATGIKDKAVYDEIINELTPVPFTGLNKSDVEPEYGELLGIYSLCVGADSEQARTVNKMCLNNLIMKETKHRKFIRNIGHEVCDTLVNSSDEIDSLNSSISYKIENALTGETRAVSEALELYSDMKHEIIENYLYGNEYHIELKYNSLSDIEKFKQIATFININDRLIDKLLRKLDINVSESIIQIMAEYEIMLDIIKKYQGRMNEIVSSKNLRVYKSVYEDVHGTQTYDLILLGLIALQLGNINEFEMLYEKFYYDITSIDIEPMLNLLMDIIENKEDFSDSKIDKRMQAIKTRLHS